MSVNEEPIAPAEILAARFETRAEADPIRERIEALGYAPAEVSYIADPRKCSSTFDAPGSHWRRMGAGGVAAGAATGGVVSLAITALGLGSIAFLGPVGVAAAAAMGGYIGVTLGLGKDSDAAQACEAAIREGALVMAVQTHPGDEKRVREALGNHIIGVESDEYYLR